MATSKLNDVHSAIVASLSGYKEALAKSDDPDMSALCQEMIALRSGHHQDIHSILEKHGEKAEDGETIMSKIQETVISVRAAITGIDKDTLPSFIRGEESILSKYDDAIAESEGDAAIESTLNKQKADIANVVAKMKAMSPS